MGVKMIAALTAKAHVVLSAVGNLQHQHHVWLLAGGLCLLRLLCRGCSRALAF